MADTSDSVNFHALSPCHWVANFDSLTFKSMSKPMASMPVVHCFSSGRSRFTKTTVANLVFARHDRNVICRRRLGCDLPSNMPFDQGSTDQHQTKILFSCRIGECERKWDGLFNRLLHLSERRHGLHVAFAILPWHAICRESCSFHES